MTDKKILVLGSAPHSKLVTAYTWDNLPANLNVADHDVIILNLVPFLNEEFARSMDLGNLPSWQQFAHFLFSENSEVIAIGIPTSEFSLGDNPYQSPTWWLPAIPVYNLEPGQQIKNIDPEFNYYFRYVKQWFFHVSLELKVGHPGLEVYTRTVDSGAEGLTTEIKPIAETRFGRFVAFNLSFQLLGQGRDFQEIIVRQQSGSIIWLPPPTEITDYEAVNLILRERYGLLLEQTGPAWATPYKLPRQVPVETNITRIEQEIQRLTTELDNVRQQLHQEARFQKLLYEQGEALELVVRDAFRELDAQVTDPAPRAGREDGYLVDPAGRNGILEIKGRKGNLELGDIRQLGQWVSDATDEGWDGKGILIANLKIGNPIGQRNELFHPQGVEAAARRGLCLMTTTQLFNALCAHQRGELDVSAFWDTVFNANGLCPLPELEPPAAT